MTGVKLMVSSQSLGACNPLPFGSLYVDQRIADSTRVTIWEPG